MGRKLSGKWRLGPLLLLAIFTIIFLTPPFIATLSREPRAQRIAIVNGARPEFLRNTLRDLVGGHDPQQRGADTVIFVFADKREYDTAASQLGGARFPVGRCDIMVAWLGCRPLQILQAFGIRKTGEIIETFASTTSTVDRCHEDGAIPSSTAALLASNSGEFLLATAGRVLRWGADDEGLFAHDAKVVVIQPSDAVLCSGHAHASSALFATLDSCSMRDCVKLVSVAKGNNSAAAGLPFFVDSGAALLRWWRREHPPSRDERQRHQHRPAADSPLDLTALAKPGYGSRFSVFDDVELFSPFFFVGTLHGIAKFSELVQDVVNFESPIPPGYSHEVVIASVVRNMRDHQWLRKSNKWLNLKPFTVHTLPAVDYPVGSRSTCFKERACRSRPRLLTDAASSEGPVAFIRPQVCPKQQPLQPPRISAPCRSSLYDDFYLLHKGIVDPVQNVTTSRRHDTQPMEVLPLSLVQSAALTRRWLELGNDAVGRASVRGRMQHGPPESMPTQMEQQHDAEASECPGRALNAVLGMCGGYEPSVVGLFVRTFVKFHKRGCTKLLLFVDEEVLSAYQTAYGGEEDVEVLSTLPFKASLKLKDCGPAVYRTELFVAWMDSEDEHHSPLDAGHGTATTATTADGQQLSPQIAAAVPVGATIRGQPTPPPYGFVMIVDTRDAFFQGDPFEPVEKIAQSSSESTDVARSAVYLIAERFDGSSIDLYYPIVYEFNERLAGASCGQAAVHWSQRLQVAPIPTPHSTTVHRKVSPRRKNGGDLERIAAARKGRGEWTPVEPLPIVCSGMLFGTYHAMRDLSHLLAESLIARLSEDQQLCGAPIDQGMLNCLLYGGLAHANFGHDVVLLNPYTQPYTNLFRSHEEMRFGDDANSSFGFKFLQTCSSTPRRFAQVSAKKIHGTVQSPLQGVSRQFAVVHQADRFSELNFYVTEVLTQNDEVQPTV